MKIIKLNRFTIALIFLLGIFSFTATSCLILKKDKQSVAEKKQAETDKKADAEYKKARKHQNDIQSKDVKKRMKKSKKQAKKLNKSLERKGSKTKCST